MKLWIPATAMRFELSVEESLGGKNTEKNGAMRGRESNDLHGHGMWVLVCVQRATMKWQLLFIINIYERVEGEEDWGKRCVRVGSGIRRVRESD